MNVLGYLMAAVFFFCGIFCFGRGQVVADTSSSDNGNIQIEDVGIDTALPTARVKKQVIKQDVNTYDIKTLANEEERAYSFSLSNSLIDYGILSPTNNVYRTTDISLENAGNKFIVVVFEDKSLTIQNSLLAIADTTCDNGSCSEITSALWENTLTYGFGYRCDDVIGNNCLLGFKLDNYYKQFSNASLLEDGQVVMENKSAQKNPESEITYKLNISKSQAKGDYMNNITYIAVPGY